MPQTLLEMAKDLVMAQIEARQLSPDEMRSALQHTYATLQALQAQEDTNGGIAIATRATTSTSQLAEKYYETCGDVSGVWSHLQATLHTAS